MTSCPRPGSSHFLDPKLWVPNICCFLTSALRAVPRVLSPHHRALASLLSHMSISQPQPCRVLGCSIPTTGAASASELVCSRWLRGYFQLKWGCFRRGWSSQMGAVGLGLRPASPQPRLRSCLESLCALWDMRPSGGPQSPHS